MVDRPTISDLAAKAGVSIATVDRVLNRRLPVRADTAQRVVEAAEAIGFHATGLLKRRLTEVPIRKFAFILQKRDEFYQQMAAELTAAIRAAREVEGKIHIEFIEQIEPQIVAQRIREVAPKFDATAAVVLSHPATHDAIEQVRTMGKPVFTLQSPVQSEHCAGHIGIDGRACGRIAGWTISRQARKPGKVGIIVGSHNYLNQESSEIAFRTYMREHGPEFQLLEPIMNFDDVTIAYEAVSKMLHDTPNLVAIYEIGGGMAGLIRALRERKGKKRPVTVCNELTEATRKGLVDGIIDVALVTPLPAMAKRCVEQMIKATSASDVPHFQPAFLPPDIRMSENV